jgi:hypothetical protein
MTHIQELRDVIHHLHGGEAKHLESVPITEHFQGQVVWDGIVEVIHLKGHPKTDRVYAWLHHTDDPAKPKRHVTVLHIPPVVSPRTAVQAAIVQEYKDRAKTN